MEEKEINTTEYLVPANVAARFEFFDGFGWYELKIVTIACLIGVLIFFGIGLFKKTILIDPNEMTFEMSVGFNEDNYNVNEDGYIVKREPYIHAAIRMFFIIIPAAGSFFMVKREPSSGLSMIDTYKAAKNFKSKQKRYLYRYNSGTEVGK